MLLELLGKYEKATIPSTLPLASQICQVLRPWLPLSPTRVAPSALRHDTKCFEDSNRFPRNETMHLISRNMSSNVSSNQVYWLVQVNRLMSQHTWKQKNSLKHKNFLKISCTPYCTPWNICLPGLGPLLPPALCLPGDGSCDDFCATSRLVSFCFKSFKRKSFCEVAGKKHSKKH